MIIFQTIGLSCNKIIETGLTLHLLGGTCVFIHLFWIGYLIGCLSSESVYEKFGAQTLETEKVDQVETVLDQANAHSWNFLCLEPLTQIT